jgi:hypothetical protein
MLCNIAKWFLKTNSTLLNDKFPFLKKAKGSGRYPNKEKVRKFANYCNCEINLDEYSGVETIRGYRWLNENDISETFSKTNNVAHCLVSNDDDYNSEEEEY